MDKETQMIVDKLDFFRDAIVHHDEYKTQDLIHWLAVAGDMIEELAGVKEQLSGMEIMLTRAQSAAETWERKCREQCSWISVEERLPDEGGEYIVLVQLPDGTKDRRWDIFHPDAGWCDDCDAKVLFWMSFDSLPEEE